MVTFMTFTNSSHKEVSYCVDGSMFVEVHRGKPRGKKAKDVYIKKYKNVKACVLQYFQKHPSKTPFYSAISISTAYNTFRE